MSLKGPIIFSFLGISIALLFEFSFVTPADGTRDLIDQRALTRRIVALESTTALSPEALRDRYHAICDRLIPLLPPDPEYAMTPSGGIVVFDPANFQILNEGLEPIQMNGVDVYPVIALEDKTTRRNIFLNNSSETISIIYPANNYNPYAWLFAHHPEIYVENADPEEMALYESVYDPARITVIFYLLPIDQVTAFATAQLAVNQNNTTMMMFGEEPQEATTDLTIFGIEPVSNGMAIGIAWPEDFTNKLEIAARTNLGQTGWFLVATNLQTAGLSSLWWTDTAILTNISRFYRVGNSDLDTDLDGITDFRERSIYGTDEQKEDSDGDGLNDYTELFIVGTNPWLQDTDGDGVNDWEDQYPLTHGPVIEVLSPIANETYTQSTITVIGTISDICPLHEIRVNSELVTEQATNGNVVSFQHSLSFGDGSNGVIVSVFATNNSSSRLEFYINIEAKPPSVMIINPEDNQSVTNMNVRVVVQSDVNTANILINNTNGIRDGYLYSAWIALVSGTNLINTSCTENGQTSTNSISVICNVSSGYSSQDADGDGILNQYDLFPDDPIEWDDSDADGCGDNFDPEPLDPAIRSTVTIDLPENGIIIKEKF